MALADHANFEGPLWKRLEAALLADIREGRFDDAGRLPSEHELAERFSVNRHTARQALAGLVQRGIVFKRKGGGSYLVPERLDYEIGARTRFNTNIAQQGREPSRTVIEVGERPAHGAVAAALAMTEGEPAVFILAVGKADDTPVSVSETYLPAERFAGIGALYSESLSMTKALVAYGVTDYTRDVTRVIARNPSQTDVQYLMQPATTPVLAVESIDVDSLKRPIVYHETRFAGERVHFVIR
jgi:GntR family phosphonate transport system transcriptional regulator